MSSRCAIAVNSTGRLKLVTPAAARSRRWRVTTRIYGAKGPHVNHVRVLAEYLEK